MRRNESHKSTILRQRSYLLLFLAVPLSFDSVDSICVSEKGSLKLSSVFFLNFLFTFILSVVVYVQVSQPSLIEVSLAFSLSIHIYVNHVEIKIS